MVANTKRIVKIWAVLLFCFGMPVLLLFPFLCVHTRQQKKTKTGKGLNGLLRISVFPVIKPQHKFFDFMGFFFICMRPQNRKKNSSIFSRPYLDYHSVAWCFLSNAKQSNVRPHLQAPPECLMLRWAGEITGRHSTFLHNVRGFEDTGQNIDTCHTMQQNAESLSCVQPTFLWTQEKVMSQILLKTVAFLTSGEVEEPW